MSLHQLIKKPSWCKKGVCTNYVCGSNPCKSNLYQVLYLHKLTLGSWWQRPVWVQLAHNSSRLCEPYEPGGSHASPSACTPCGTSQPSCIWVSWSPYGPDGKTTKDELRLPYQNRRALQKKKGRNKHKVVEFTFFSASNFLTRMAFIAA